MTTMTPSSPWRWFGFALLLASAGCESGWDIDGEVLTGAVTDKTRRLLVYVAEGPRLEPGVVPPNNPGQLEMVKTEPTIPATSTTFSQNELGCHAGTVMVVAWAPRVDPGPQNIFNPQTGDLLALSDIRKPYCGPRTKPDHVVLTLTDQPFQAPPTPAPSPSPSSAP
jgi:hypothetical protein